MAQMTDADALDPIPNAIFFNWATIFVLAFGNLAALDFQACSICACIYGYASTYGWMYYTSILPHSTSRHF